MTVCVIPARGGSKRIPRKNIKPFLGRPMNDHAAARVARPDDTPVWCRYTDTLLDGALYTFVPLMTISAPSIQRAYCGDRKSAYGLMYPEHALIMMETDA